VLRNVDVALVEGHAGERSAWRVLARPAGEREAAVKLCDQLRARGADCLVRRRQAGE
jgi:hypothetical protein